ncbi:MAG: hypothetical protein JWP99_59 [Devosia sp.]|nr:hypothetical protein [Devosia sp.]
MNRPRASLLAAMFVLFGVPHWSYADGRAEWSDYAWQKIEISSCIGSPATLACPLYHQKWDWKRNQWVDITVRLDPSAGRVWLTQRLTNSDNNDQDFVCVTALIVDAEGRDLIAHHQNWHISSAETIEKSFTYESVALDSAQTIHIGSKQCRAGGSQDDATYARVLADIAN